MEPAARDDLFRRSQAPSGAQTRTSPQSKRLNVRRGLKSMTSKTFKTTIVRDGVACFIPLTFDPKVLFGKVRAPVKVTVNGYTYRSTIAAMGSPPCIPLRKSHRDAAGIEGGETVSVRLELDEETREVTPPADL